MDPILKVLLLGALVLGVALGLYASLSFSSPTLLDFPGIPHE